MKWIVTTQWAGNLQNIPLTGYIQDYRQLEPGVITVAIRCEESEVAAQVAQLIGPYCCNVMIGPDVE